MRFQFFGYYHHHSRLPLGLYADPPPSSRPQAGRKTESWRFTCPDIANASRSREKCHDYLPEPPASQKKVKSATRVPHGFSTHHITAVVVSLVAATTAIFESRRFPCPATANVSASRRMCHKRVFLSPASRRKTIAVSYLLCVCFLSLSDCSRTLHRGGNRQDGGYKT